MILNSAGNFCFRFWTLINEKFSEMVFTKLLSKSIPSPSTFETRNIGSTASLNVFPKKTASSIFLTTTVAKSSYREHTPLIYVLKFQIKICSLQVPSFKSVHKMMSVFINLQNQRYLYKYCLLSLKMNLLIQGLRNDTINI